MHQAAAHSCIISAPTRDEARSPRTAARVAGLATPSNKSLEETKWENDVLATGMSSYLDSQQVMSFAEFLLSSKGLPSLEVDLESSAIAESQRRRCQNFPPSTQLLQHKARQLVFDFLNIGRRDLANSGRAGKSPGHEGRQAAGQAAASISTVNLQASTSEIKNQNRTQQAPNS